MVSDVLSSLSWLAPSKVHAITSVRKGFLKALKSLNPIKYLSAERLVSDALVGSDS